MKIHCEIQGIRPLLQNRFPDETFEAESKVKTRVGSHKADDPQERLYKLPDGRIYQPAEHILRSMVKAATNFTIGGKGKKTYKDIIQSSVVITPEAIIHKHQTWIPDKRSVVIPATRGRLMRIRPRFDDWNLEFDIEVLEEQINSETIKRILDYAGYNVGLGDYRPRFGGFIVTHFKAE